jgi:nucleoside-diphosphate-sugar epimerase
MTKNNTILITGAAGLIGNALTAQLRTTDSIVIPYDVRFPITHDGYGELGNIAQLSERIAHCNGIVHLAGVSRVVWGEKDPQQCWDTNVIATKSLLEILARLPHPPWIIYASSREVYGQQKILPVTEDALLQPMNVYARSKVAAENLMEQYQQQGLKTAILRFSSVYGSADDYVDRVVPAFCRQALLKEPLRVEGQYNQFDFTHVQDTVRGLMAVIQKFDQGMTACPTLHLTTGKSTQLLELIGIIEQHLKRPIKFYEAPSRSYDVSQFCGSPAKAKKILDWEPKISLSEGIRDLLQQYQTKLQRLI